MKSDKPLIASAVVLVAAVLGVQGITVSDAEQQALVEAIGNIVAGSAIIAATLRVWFLALRKRDEKGPTS